MLGKKKAEKTEEPKAKPEPKKAKGKPEVKRVVGRRVHANEDPDRKGYEPQNCGFHNPDDK